MPHERVDDALRLLHVDLLERGASAHELGEWLWGVHWFPHLRRHPAIVALAQALPAAWTTGELCDPQILLQFPHVGPEPAITFHVDREPEWAAGRRFLRIVGVALGPWRRENGALLIEREGAGSASEPDEPFAIELDVGDAVMLAPWVSHSGGINRTGSIRYCIYFRWLESQPFGIDFSDVKR